METAIPTATVLTATIHSVSVGITVAVESVTIENSVNTVGVSVGTVDDSDVGVEAVELSGGGAVEVVPPVTHEVLLVEHGAVGAEEGVLAAVSLADVEHL